MITIIVATMRGYDALRFHPASVYGEWDPKGNYGEVYFTSGKGALAALGEAVQVCGDRL